MPLISMFVGGFAAAKVAGPITRTGAAIHGAVLWSLATLASGVMLVSLISSLVGGVARIGGEAVSAAGRAIGAAPAGVLQQTGVTTDDLLGQVNERLRALGKPTITADQLSSATREALRAAVRDGRIDREVIVSAMAQNTALSEADARQLAGTLEQRWEQQTSELRERASKLGTQASSAALQAAETTGKGLLGLFFAMLLGLVAATAGTMLGVSRAQLAVAERANSRAERLEGRHA